MTRLVTADCTRGHHTSNLMIHVTAYLSAASRTVGTEIGEEADVAPVLPTAVTALLQHGMDFNLDEACTDSLLRWLTRLEDPPSSSPRIR